MRPKKSSRRPTWNLHFRGSSSRRSRGGFLALLFLLLALLGAAGCSDEPETAEPLAERAPEPERGDRQPPHIVLPEASGGEVVEGGAENQYVVEQMRFRAPSAPSAARKIPIPDPSDDAASGERVGDGDFSEIHPPAPAKKRVAGKDLPDDLRRQAAALEAEFKGLEAESAVPSSPAPRAPPPPPRVDDSGEEAMLAAGRRESRQALKKDLFLADEAEIELPESDEVVFAIPDAPPVLDAADGNARVGGSTLARKNAPRESGTLHESVVATIAEKTKKEKQEAARRKAEEAAAREAEKRAAREQARVFLERIRSLEDLSFQSATGYWANTYVPGDARLRFLADRLQGLAPAPHELSERVGQPVDTPRRSAIGVAIDADRRSQNGPGRLLVRVGLRATDRFAGRRPAMNLAVVLDVGTSLEKVEAARLRALLEAFAEHQEVGDRFRLFVTGPGGGLALDAESFRHGPIQDFFQRRFLEAGSDGDQLVDRGFTEVQAYKSALEAVAAADDPDAPLGSSAVVVVATEPLGGATRGLERQAHRAAVAGIQTSAIGMAQAEMPELRRLALAGQGRLHQLAEGRGISGDLASQASALVDLELQSTARTVARAVRLRIRLAPGVELVDVLGSHRLDAARAEKVREAEEAVDRRLARNLGLAADRGEDDEGIQIVIPAFYAGDTHSVLLDVVAPGAGPIADVRVKFKDLVHLENGVVRSHLHVDRGHIEPGAIERSVLASRIAYEVELGLLQAATQLETGAYEAARESLRSLHRLLAGIPLEKPTLEAHRGLGRDREMIKLFLDAMEAHQSQPQWAEALRYAGLRKRLPAPERL